MKTPTTLLISEDFYSVQGEGKTTGVPAYFIRLANCNLSCGASVSFVNDYKKGIKTEAEHGDLHKEGKATWTCDSIPVWAKGVERPFQYLIDRWKEQGIYDDICNGIIHLIWTGGEPTIKMHQEAIYNFFKYWSSLEFANHVNAPLYNGESIEYRKRNGYNQFNEIETNGTSYIEDNLWKILDQINCSAKLSNSGMTEKQRIVPIAIERIMEHSNYQFKFVVSTEDDIKEMFDTYITPFNIPLTNVCCMPGMDSREDYFERTKFIMEMAIKYKFIGLSRAHIAAWNQVTGV